MQKLIFLLILTLLLIKPTANAIFLSTAGVSQLPIAYILVAIMAFFITLYYNRFIASNTAIKIFYRSTQLNIVCLVLIGILLQFPILKLSVAYIFYLFIALFGILSASQFWILANQIFNAREARKYFGIIGVGAIAGGISGGYLTSLLSSFLQSEVIPFIAAGVLVMALSIIKKISSDPTIKKERSNSGSVNSGIKGSFRLIKGSRHLTYLAAIIALSVFVAKLIDFQFGYFATLAYPKEEDLTQFYGIMFSTFNVVAIAIQLFLTTRVVGKLGIGFSILLLPFLLLVNAGLLLVIPGLVFVIGLRLSDASMKQSINKAAFELMMLPIPDDVKLKTKTFLDVFIDSLATGISGIILLLVLKAFDLPNWVVTSVILAGVLVWAYLANKIRNEYKSVFRQSLKIQSKNGDSIGSSILDGYKNILLTGDDFQILKALTQLKLQPVEGLSSVIMPLLNSKNPKIVVATLDMIIYDKMDFSEEVIPLIDHNDQNIRIAAFEYVINHQDKLDPDFLLQRINGEDPEDRLIAMTAYAKEFQNDPRTLKILRIEDRLNLIINASENLSSDNIKLGILKTIGYGKLDAFYYLIDEYLNSDNQWLRSQAMLAAGETKTSRYLKRMLLILENESPPEVIYAAMAKFGIKRLGKLSHSLITQRQFSILKNIPRVLELIPSQQSVSLLELLSTSDDLFTQHNAIKSLRILSDNYPLLSIDQKIINRILIAESRYNNIILQILLEQESRSYDHLDKAESLKELMEVLKLKIDENLMIIFELLHIKYPPENYMELYGLVKGDDNVLRNNAIEYVDNSLSFDLKSTIIPLLEFTSKKNIADQFPKEEMDEQRMKSFLLTNRDKDIMMAAKKFYIS